jgi:hypothetical protein
MTLTREITYVEARPNEMSAGVCQAAELGLLEAVRLLNLDPVPRLRYFVEDRQDGRGVAFRSAPISGLAKKPAGTLKGTVWVRADLSPREAAVTAIHEAAHFAPGGEDEQLVEQLAQAVVDRLELPPDTIEGALVMLERVTGRSSAELAEQIRRDREDREFNRRVSTREQVETIDRLVASIRRNRRVAEGKYRNWRWATASRVRAADLWEDARNAEIAAVAQVDELRELVCHDVELVDRLVGGLAPAYAQVRAHRGVSGPCLRTSMS